MKALKKQIRLLSLTLSLIILFQSCVVYKSSSTSLEQLSKENIKVKIETTFNKELKFKYIVFENGNYFGVNKEKGKYVKTLLKKEDIKSLKVQNKSTSTVLSVLGIATGILAIIALTSIIDLSNGS